MTGSYERVNDGIGISAHSRRRAKLSVSKVATTARVIVWTNTLPAIWLTDRSKLGKIGDPGCHSRVSRIATKLTEGPRVFPNLSSMEKFFPLCITGILAGNRKRQVRHVGSINVDHFTEYSNQNVNNVRGTIDLPSNRVDRFVKRPMSAEPESL